LKHGSGIKVMDEDWDNLIILDACRYDIFKNHSKFINQNIEKKVSQGSWTLEFIKSNFVGKSFHDTVYVTSNVFSNIIPEGSFLKKKIIVNQQPYKTYN
jgi:hypothetical protein